MSDFTKVMAISTGAAGHHRRTITNHFAGSTLDVAACVVAMVDVPLSNAPLQTRID
jgi:hypothetical protein